MFRPRGTQPSAQEAIRSWVPADCLLEAKLLISTFLLALIRKKGKNRNKNCRLWRIKKVSVCVCVYVYLCMYVYVCVHKYGCPKRPGTSDPLGLELQSVLNHSTWLLEINISPLKYRFLIAESSASVPIFYYLNFTLRCCHSACHEETGLSPKQAGVHLNLKGTVQLYNSILNDIIKISSC